MIYGSGLRSGDSIKPMCPATPSSNLGMSHELLCRIEGLSRSASTWSNLFDHIYEIRDGTGVGIFPRNMGKPRILLGLFPEVLNGPCFPFLGEKLCRPSMGG